MDGGKPSETAALVAKATVLLAREPATRDLVPADAAVLCEAFVADLPGGKRLLRRLGQGWFRRLAWLAEGATIPGLFAHYAVRKARIEAAARSGLAAGIRQLVVVGAGFDTLAARLHREHPDLLCFELDHSATQAAKRASLERRGLAGPNLRFVPLDLRSTTPEAALRGAAGYDPAEPSLVVLEGVLMYLPADAVERTLRGLRQAVGPGSRLALTFLRRGDDGRPAFLGQRRRVARWLRRRQEPFLWGASPGEVVALLARCGFEATGTPREPEPPRPGLRLPQGECLALARADAGHWLNDVQTRLNATRVLRLTRPRSTQDVQAAVRRAGQEGLCVSVSGGRHAQGGQQFAADGLHIDTTAMDRILGLDRERGILHAEAGIQWPALIAKLAEMQAGEGAPWGIRQKQTGANNLCLGGALSSNVHGRGLAMAPIVADVEAFLLVDAEGNVRRCSRTEDAELFGLAVGGYGLFGVITEVWLRLRRRCVLERVVEEVAVDDLVGRMAERVRDGYEYGDLQYATDLAGDGFLRKGIFSCYRPTGRPLPAAGQLALTKDDWDRLVALAHQDRAAAFRKYREHYLATSGQLYDSDQHQLAHYLDDYHQRYDAAIGATPACEVISELFVARPALAAFLADLREFLRREGEAPIYGTIRLVERDAESFLAWAREPWACTIVNLHVEHTPEGVARAQRLFRGMVDVTLAHGGSFFLTYHRWATAAQVERAHPHIRAFLQAKRKWDPAGRFDSEWHRHMATLLG